MKKLAALLLALAFFSASCAQALAYDAPETFRAQYQTQTGKSHVIVDAKVIVPDTDEFKQFEVLQRRFNVADVWQLARAVMPEVNWERYPSYGISSYDGFLPYTGDPDVMEKVDMLPPSIGEHVTINYFRDKVGSVVFDDMNPAHRYYSVWANIWDYETAFGPHNVMRTLAFTEHHGYNLPYYHLQGIDGIYPLEKDAIAGQALTLLEAQKLAEDFVLKAAPDFRLYAKGQAEGMICYHKEGTSVYDNRTAKTNAYGFVFSRNVNSIPITIAGGEMANAMSKDMNDFAASPPPGYECISVLVHDETVISFIWDYAYEIGEAIVEDSELMTFDKIMDIFAAIAPLSIASMEGEGNNELVVNEIRLGYMAVRLKDNPDKWVLRPVWDFFGTRSFAREYYAWLGLSNLTIDAIDGTVIDRQFGY
jgi:hypothetical protein